MEWWLSLIIILGSLLFFMALGMPVAFCFTLINVVGAYFLWGGVVGLEQLILSMFDSVTKFTMLPLPIFILMGEVMWHSGIAKYALDGVDKILGRMPGRLSVAAVSAGTLFATFTGSSLATTAMLGQTLVPEMEKRGYHKSMALGPVLGSAGLAVMIPPSGLAVLLGAIGEISIGKLLVAIIVPGLLMAVLYTTYIIGRCTLFPTIAPPYDVTKKSFGEKLYYVGIHVIPLSFIILMVLGAIFLGVATPTEAAALGALATFIISIIYKKFTWHLIKTSLRETVTVAGMLLLILTGATAFSQILAFSGVTIGIQDVIMGIPVQPIMIIIFMQLIVLIMGTLIDPPSIMMITLPIFIPIVHHLGFSEIWFAALFLLNIEMAATTPPFGLSLYVMKSVSPPDTTMGHIMKAAVPFLVCDLIAMVLMMIFPSIALWLPGKM